MHGLRALSGLLARKSRAWTRHPNRARSDCAVCSAATGLQRILAIPHLVVTSLDDVAVNALSEGRLDRATGASGGGNSQRQVSNHYEADRQPTATAPPRPG